MLSLLSVKWTPQALNLVSFWPTCPYYICSDSQVRITGNHRLLSHPSQRFPCWASSSGWKRSSYPRCSWRHLPRNRIYSGTWTSPRCCGKLHWRNSCDSPLHTRLHLDNDTQNGRVRHCTRAPPSYSLSRCECKWTCVLYSPISQLLPRNPSGHSHVKPFAEKPLRQDAFWGQVSAFLQAFCECGEAKSGKQKHKKVFF